MEDLENQNLPLAPVGLKSDEQPPQPTAMKPYHSKHEKSSKCLVYVLAAVVIQGAVLLIFASVVLRVTNPKLRLNSVAVQNLRYLTSNLTSLNMTMLAELTVDNSNFGRYDFDNFTAVVLHGNSTIGGGDISGGSVAARKTELMNVTMQVRTENLNLSSSGGDTTDVVEIRSYAKMSGRVHVMKIVNRRKTVEMNCTMSVNLTSQSIMDDLLCT